MADKVKVGKLIAPKVPFTLEVDGGDKPIKLELELAWTMRAVIGIETILRTRYGVELNILQNPGNFWTGMDCTKLALGLWACSWQEHPEYADDEGFETIQSFMNMSNYGAALKALRDAFLESLPDKQKQEILKAEQEAEAKANAPADPQQAPAQQ